MVSSENVVLKRFLRKKEAAEAQAKAKSSPVLGNKKNLIAGRYEIHHEQILGHGSFGAVVKATDHWTNEQVAVKVVDCSQLSPAGKDLILGETKILRYLTKVQEKKPCPYNVKVLQVVVEEHMCYSFFELIPGKRLLDLMDQFPHGLSGKKTQKIFRNLCLGLQALHNNGVCHLDIKLENIMIETSTNKVKLLDFGFSQFCFGPDGKEIMLEKWCGTIPYISPEIMRHDPFSGFKADIYNMGVLLYAMVFHRFPYMGKNVDQLYPKALRMECDAKNWYQDSRATPLLVDLLHHLLEPDPELRYNINQVLDHPWVEESRKKPFFMEEW